MKKTFSLMLACLLLATTSQPVEAAQLYPTVEAAKAKVTESKIAVNVFFIRKPTSFVDSL